MAQINDHCAIEPVYILLLMQAPHAGTKRIGTKVWRARRRIQMLPTRSDMRLILQHCL